MSAVPSPTVDVDQLEAAPVPVLDNFLKGTDIKGQLIHISIAHIVMIIPGSNYNTYAMTSGHNLQIVSIEQEPPP